MDAFALWTGVAALGLLAWFGIKRLQGGNAVMDLQTLPSDGQIVDVRSPGEYRRGHAPGSMNIPLDELPRRLPELDRGRPVVLCCASGARSSSAHGMLKRAGFQDVRDVGSWTRLRKEAS